MSTLGKKGELHLVLHPSFVVVINVWIYSILRPVDFVRGTAFAIRPYNLAGGEKAAKNYLKDLEPGGSNGIFFAYEVNLVRKTCCGGFIYRTSDDVRSRFLIHILFKSCSTPLSHRNLLAS